jgi:hypothetical protein
MMAAGCRSSLCIQMEPSFFGCQRERQRAENNILKCRRGSQGIKAPPVGTPPPRINSSMMTHEPTPDRQIVWRRCVSSLTDGPPLSGRRLRCRNCAMRLCSVLSPRSSPSVYRAFPGFCQCYFVGFTAICGIEMACGRCNFAHVFRPPRRAAEQTTKGNDYAIVLIRCCLDRQFHHQSATLLILLRRIMLAWLFRGVAYRND